LTPQLTLIDNKNKRASQTNKNKTPIQIANNKDYLTKRRLNMSEELANIENERLANFRSNKKNNIKNDKETLKQRKIKYLKEFNSSINGPLNEEDWVGPEMDLFHEKMNKLEMFYCENCSELWLSMSKECLTCKKNKTKYHKINNMVPSHSELPLNIKKLFEELTMV